MEGSKLFCNCSESKENYQNIEESKVAEGLLELNCYHCGKFLGKLEYPID